MTFERFCRRHVGLYRGRSIVRDRRGRGLPRLADYMLRVEEREAALPSLTRWRVSGKRRVDWAALEADLGTALPSDFRSMAEAYRILVVDDFLTVSVP